MSATWYWKSTSVESDIDSLHECIKKLNIGECLSPDHSTTKWHSKFSLLMKGNGAEKNKEQSRKSTRIFVVQSLPDGDPVLMIPRFENGERQYHVMQASNNIMGLPAFKEYPARKNISFTGDSMSVGDFKFDIGRCDAGAVKSVILVVRHLPCQGVLAEHVFPRIAELLELNEKYNARLLFRKESSFLNDEQKKKTGFVEAMHVVDLVLAVKPQGR